MLHNHNAIIVCIRHVERIAAAISQFSKSMYFLWRSNLNIDKCKPITDANVNFRDNKTLNTIGSVTLRLLVPVILFNHRHRLPKGIGNINLERLSLGKGGRQFTD